MSRELRCPYCDYLFRNAWEMGEGDVDEECPECGKHFEWSTEVTVEYEVSQDCALNKEEHEWFDRGNFSICGKCRRYNWRKK